MNWYKMILGSEDDYALTSFMATEKDLFGRDPFDLKYGKVIEDWNTESLLRSGEPAYDGEPGDNLSNSLDIPVFSRRLRESLAELSIGAKDIQYLPIRVFRSTGEELPGFSVANVITRIAALDREHSKMLDVDHDQIDPLTGQPDVLGVWTAALRKDCIEGHDVIRLLEFFPPVFVSERFVEVFRKNGFRGATFIPVPVH